MAAAKRITLCPGLPVCNGAGAPTTSSFAIDSGGGSIDRLAWSVQTEEAVTISHLGFRYGTRTGTPVQHRIGLQGINTSGNPDGTYLGGGSPNSGTFTPPANATWDGTWQWVALDNAYSASRGEKLMIVLEPVGTPDGSNNSSFTRGLTNYRSFNAFPVSLAQTDGGAWAKSNAVYSIIGWKNSGATIVQGCPIEALFTTDIGTNGHRQACKLALPTGFGTSIKVTGVRFLGDSTASGTFRIGIWDAAGSVIQAVDFDSDILATQAEGAVYEVYFDDTPSTLNTGTTYYFGIERVDVAIGLFGASVDTTAELIALPYSAAILATWNGSAWSDDTITKPFIELILDDWTAPSGGGGGLKIAGVGGLAG